MAHLYWPRRLLCGLSKSFDPAYRTTSGGSGRVGLGQVIASDAGVWKSTVGSIPVLQNDRHSTIILWRAIDGLLGGRTGEIAMPVSTRGRRPLPDGVTDDDVDSESDVPHDDEAPFDDDSEYDGSFIEVEVAADAALRATTLVLTKNVCGDIEPGMDFSIGVRLYRVKRVTAQSAGAATIVINFPLREAVTAGSHCEFEHPVCLMRLASDQEMDLPVELNRKALPTINMVEAV